MLKFLTDISRTLDASNIDHAIQIYEAELSNDTLKLLLFNADTVSTTYSPKLGSQ